MNVAEAVVRQLEARQVPFVATLNGHGLDPLYLAFRRSSIRVVDVRNEQAASYMAEVAGRLSRRVGVCAVSGAVAHVNALSGVLNAWFDGAPMLLITGTTPLASLGWGDFQDFDPVPVTAPITKYARWIDIPRRAAQIVHEAFAAATTGRPGPVHLALPLDVAGASVPEQELVLRGPLSGAVELTGAAEEGLVERAASWLQQAQRPLLVVGSGLYYARGEGVLKAFLDETQVPTVMPIWDRGCVPEPHDAFLGVIGALTGGPRLLPDADLIILAGVDFDYRIGQLQPPNVSPQARIVRIHADPHSVRTGVPADLEIVGSPATVLGQLLEACRERRYRCSGDWLGEARRRREEHRRRCLATAHRLGRHGITGCDVVQAIHEVATDETVILVDGGNIGQWFHHLMPDRCPGHWISCGRSGVVGWGLPGALAARLVFPDRPVLLLSGDGSFTFTVAELECAARQGLPFAAVVADDRRWGITASSQVSRYGEPLYSTLGPTRLDRVAEGFGCAGLRVERREELIPQLRAALAADRPTVLHVPIVPGGPQD